MVLWGHRDEIGDFRVGVPDEAELALPWGLPLGGSGVGACDSVQQRAPAQDVLRLELGVVLDVGVRVVASGAEEDQAQLEEEAKTELASCLSC